MSCILSLGNRYNVGSLSGFSLDLIRNFRTVSQPCPSTATFSISRFNVLKLYNLQTTATLFAALSTVKILDTTPKVTKRRFRFWG